MTKEDNVKININIENNLLSKNKEKCCKVNDKKNNDDKPKIYSNPQYPPMINEYYGEMAKKKLYDVSRNHLPINLPSYFPSYYQQQQNMNTVPPLIQQDETQPVDNEIQPVDDDDEIQPVDDDDNVPIAYTMSNESINFEAERNLIINKIQKYDTVPQWKKIEIYNLYQYIDINKRKPRDAPDNWKEIIQNHQSMVQE